MKSDISKRPSFHPADVNELATASASVEKLEFSIDAKSASVINEARGKYDKWINRLHVDHIIFEDFGKDECKTLGVSPDAVMQLAFQLAFYNLEGRLVSTYESCSTAAYKHGRTETIRPCTLETKAICVAMTQKRSELPTSDLKKMIRDCSRAHNALTKDAVMGN